MDLPVDPIRAVRAEVTLEGTRPDLPALASSWFKDGWQMLGGWLRTALNSHPLPDLEVSEDLLSARVRRHFPEIGRPFLLLAAQTGEDGVQDWNRLYNLQAMDDFLNLVSSSLPAMAAMVMGGKVEPASAERPAGPGRPRFHPIMWRYPDKNETSLVLTADEPFLLDEGHQERALLAFLRGFVQACDPVYAECGVPNPTTHTPLWGTGMHVPAAQGRKKLRGFSWLTVVPKELALQLGGESAVSPTGVFAEVAELQAGGLWLLATARFQDFDKQVARQVFEVLEPILPTGLRDNYQAVEATFDWRHTR